MLHNKKEIANIKKRIKPCYNNEKLDKTGIIRYDNEKERMENG